VSGLAGVLRRPRATLAPSAALRRRLIAVLVACAVVSAAYLLWFRNASFLRVERVAVTGVSTRDGDHLRAALVAAARSMTTLHIDRDRLERAVDGYPVVRELRVSPDFPDALQIEVVEHHPAALAIAGDTKVAVAGDGTVLRGLPVKGPLPEIRLNGALPPERLGNGSALREARVLGAAPRPLTPRLRDVREGGPRGLVVRLRSGPVLVFGDMTRLRAKWTAAARVLADPAARGASYIDLRLPERPAVGGLGPAAPLESSSADTPTTHTPQAAGAAPAGGAAPQAPTAPQQPAPGVPQAGAPATGQGPAAPGPAPPAPTTGAGGGGAANPQP